MNENEYNPCINIINEEQKMNEDCIYLLDIIKEYKIIKDMKILDIGCGNGFYVFGLADYVKSICGLEPSTNMINSAIKNQNYFNKNNIKFIKGSIEDNSLNDKYDIVIFSFSLHFTNDSYKSLVLSKKYLTQNGLLIIIEPTKTYISNKLTLSHKDFDEKKYNLKQTFLNKSRKDIHLFITKHELLYYNYNINNFIVVVKNKKFLM